VADVKEEKQEVAAVPALTAADFARLDRATLRRAIVLKEILGPPVSMRESNE